MRRLTTEELKAMEIDHIQQYRQVADNYVELLKEVVKDSRLEARYAFCLHYRFRLLTDLPKS